MDKVIINHGERVTEHELGDAPLVIGRDPECDLFFADKKLSRHHARLERVGTRVRLVDLGSRNGSWVNEVRVDDREILPGDEIRLGGLLIHIERVTPPASREEEESTVYLGGSASDDSGTVMLEASVADALPEDDAEEPETILNADTATIERPAADDSATVFLTGVGSPPSPPAPPPQTTDHPMASDEAGEAEEEGDETLKRPEPERTVVLSGEPKRSPYDTGTVMFRGTADPSLQEAARAAGVVEAPPEEEPPEEASYLSVSDSTEIPEEIPSGPSWTIRFTLLSGGLALFAFFVLALPLLRIVRVASVNESEKRARVMAELLAAVNEQALGEGRVQDLVVDRVSSEGGVREAYVVSPAGEILAPGPAGRKLEIDGVESMGDARSPRLARAAGGDAVFLHPIVYRGRRVGVAVLRHRPEGTVASGATIALAFGTLLLAVAVTGSVLLAVRLTLQPIEELRGDIDAVAARTATELPLARPYVELSRLAASVRRLVRRLPR